MRISAQSLSIYANGKSPFVGLPVCDDGGRRPALFLRKHFDAAIGGGVTFVKYDHEKLTLTVRGVRSAYTLRDLSANSTAYQLWQIKNALEKWAGTKRRAAKRKALSVSERLTGHQIAEIEKLERAKAKALVRVHKPVNPSTVKPDAMSAWERDGLERWARDRAARRGLGALYGKYCACLSRPRGKFPWAEIGKDIEALGVRLDSYNSWSKVRTRKAHRGIDIPEFMKSLPLFVSGLSRKPWDAQPSYMAQRMESYRESVKRYLEALREVKFIEDQIANVRALSVAEAA
jgi:hypothetical protein